MSTVITRNEWTLTTGERILEVVTDGSIGAGSESAALARHVLGPFARLSFRKSEYGALTFTYHDGPTTFTEAQR